MYKNTTAEIRPELQTVVQEALEAEKFFIADKVMPLWPSPTKAGEYPKITKTEGGILDMADGDYTLRAPKTPYKEVDRTYVKTGFTCRDRGLTEVVDDSEQADLGRFFDAESVATRLTLANVLRAQESRVAGKIFDEAVWGKVDAAVAYTEALLATIDIALDMEEAIARVHKRGEVVNTIIMSRNIWKRIRRATLLRKYIYGDNAGGKIITKDVFLSTFQDSAPIENFFIAEAVKSTAKKNEKVTDAKLSYIWGDSYVWLGNVAGGAPEMGGAGRVIYWEEMTDSNYVVETYRDEHRSSDVVRVRQYNEEHVVNECAGTLIKTNYA